MELKFNLDNIVVVKLANGLEIIGYDKTEEGDVNHKINKAYFVELKLDEELYKSTNQISYKPDFQPLSLLVDPGESLNHELDVTLPAATVLFKLPVHPDVISHYKPLVSPIIA